MEFIETLNAKIEYREQFRQIIQGSETDNLNRFMQYLESVADGNVMFPQLPQGYVIQNPKETAGYLRSLAMHFMSAAQLDSYARMKGGMGMKQLSLGKKMASDLLEEILEVPGWKGN